VKLSTIARGRKTCFEPHEFVCLCCFYFDFCSYPNTYLFTNESSSLETRCYCSGHQLDLWKSDVKTPSTM